ncbi:MAG TPA: helix-turn-helix transcriptional regulator [Stellaceae bacterium]|nr:helix-turn-helix transcriptional regulator [Stellaceae bacterium]
MDSPRDAIPTPAGLEERRIKAGLSRVEWCRRANVHRTTVTRWLNGEFELNTAAVRRLIDAIQQAEGTA